jgi:23S rRNA pseudouridine2605 synthase
MRINKFLASTGELSRRKSEELVLAGVVTVNGQVTRNLAADVCETDLVAVNGVVRRLSNDKIYIAMNKPKKVITCCEDKRGRRTVIDVLRENAGGAKEASARIKQRGARGESFPPKNNFHFPPRVFPVGRLDYDTEGLLLLTNDGDWAEGITHPSREIEKTYQATLDADFNAADLPKLTAGIEIDGEMTRPCRAKIVRPRTVELTISEGRNRQVRKMFAACGYDVLNLCRTRIGKIELGNLAAGAWKIFPRKPEV